MKVVYSSNQLLHSPPTQLHNGKPENYPEQPDRLKAIVNELKNKPLYDFMEPNGVSVKYIETVHGKQYLRYLQDSSARLKKQEIFYPSSFITDTYAPIDSNTYKSALASAGVATTGAQLLINGEKSIYSICRPPGHHAGCNHSGGYCYINNAAVASELLSSKGKVAILDIDYHHGNGTQEIFYERDDVLYVSLHADPSEKYPYYSGYENERGKGKGFGYNLNLPLPLSTDESLYLKTLNKATREISKFKPKYLVVSFGMDTHKDDPVGSLGLSTNSYKIVGEKIASLSLPTLIIQEGGYNIKVLGQSCANFLSAFQP